MTLKAFTNQHYTNLTRTRGQAPEAWTSSQGSLSADKDSSSGRTTRPKQRFRSNSWVPLRRLQKQTSMKAGPITDNVLQTHSAGNVLQAQTEALGQRISTSV